MAELIIKADYTVLGTLAKIVSNDMKTDFHLELNSFKDKGISMKVESVKASRTYLNFQIDEEQVRELHSFLTTHLTNQKP